MCDPKLYRFNCSQNIDTHFIFLKKKIERTKESHRVRSSENKHIHFDAKIHFIFWKIINNKIDRYNIFLDIFDGDYLKYKKNDAVGHIFKFHDVIIFKWCSLFFLNRSLARVVFTFYERNTFYSSICSLIEIGTTADDNPMQYWVSKIQPLMVFKMLTNEIERGFFCLWPRCALPELLTTRESKETAYVQWKILKSKEQLEKADKKVAQKWYHG